jgi:hypothetical protein
MRRHAKEISMPPSPRYTVRLPPALDAQVQARVQAGTPFAVLIREALSAYLADTPPTGAPTSVDTPADTMRTFQEDLAALTARVRILELALTAVPTPRRQDADTPAGTMPIPADRLPTEADKALTGADTAPTPAPRAKRPAAHALPLETLQAIADERTRCEGLSLSAFAQRLYDRGIHRSRSPTGAERPVHPGTFKKWLDHARDQGLL